MTSGSYSVPDGVDQQTERDRLESQAAALWTTERTFLEEAGLAHGQRVLDLGCGPGRILGRLSTMGLSLVVGLDVNAAHIAAARSAGVVLRADGSAQPFQSGTFDLVYARFVLRHQSESTPILSEAFRVLKAGGVLVALEPDEAAIALDPPPEGWTDLLAALTVSAIRKGGDPFIGRKLKRLFMNAGFREVNSKILPITTDDVSPRAFVEAFLAPNVRPLDPDLLPLSETRSPWEAVRGWALRNDAFGYGITVFTSGRKPAMEPESSGATAPTSNLSRPSR